MTTDPTIKARLEELRGAIRAENISYGEISELQDLAKHIEPGDVELLAWAGVPEHGVDGYDGDQALADLRRIAQWLADDTENENAQNAACDINAACDWYGRHG